MLLCGTISLISYACLSFSLDFGSSMDSLDARIFVEIYVEFFFSYVEHLN